MPAKEDKGDAVLAVYFIKGAISTVSQDGVLQFL